MYRGSGRNVRLGSVSCGLRSAGLLRTDNSLGRQTPHTCARAASGIANRRPTLPGVFLGCQLLLLRQAYAAHAMHAVTWWRPPLQAHGFP